MYRLFLISFIFFSCFYLSACSQQNDSETTEKPRLPEKYEVLLGGTDVGDLKVTHSNNKLEIDYAFSNNGRGASSIETLTLSDKGLPVEWFIKGKTTFGNAVDEYFLAENGTATWRASAGEDKAEFDGNSLYVAQSASPYSLFVYANAMLSNGLNSLDALPGGQLTIKEIEPLNLESATSKMSGKIYAINGIELDPSYIVLDDHKKLFAFISPRFALIRDGFTHHDADLRGIAARLNASRFENIAKKVTHTFDKIVRINNVHIFDPVAKNLTKIQSVVINKNQIVAIQDAIDKPLPDEELIDGKGGTIIPGLFEMHGHMSDNDALLNVMAGVTSVRDMGNEIDVLDALIEKIDNKTLIGPRITKSAFIEGKSKFSAATGEMASTEQEAVDLVKMYAQRGNYFQIKIYSSINGDWVPAMAKEAKKHGMRVTGHIPAFSNVDEMIAAGYHEITHINQVMLSWVLEREEDTRTLYRITGMKRFADLDLNSEKVQNTINTMAEKNIAVDPTMVIHEFGLTARNGETRVGMQDYINNMPIGVQRSAKQALLNVEDEQEDKAYVRAFEKIVEALSMMHERGIFIVPGTDLGGAFELHRELELFQKIGMSNAEVLRRASYDMANYLGQGDTLGSIEVGKLADFFLVPGNPLENLKAIKTISMVVKDGNIYYPSQVYPEFGIKPFVSLH
jgi:imidazolonepropionase-like amidohydrolase